MANLFSFVIRAIRRLFHLDSPEWIERKLLAKRIVLLDKPITDAVAELTIAKLLFLADADAQSPIKLLINCSGGVIPAGMAIFDCMTEMKDLIHTHCYGFAGGFAAVLMAHGGRKNRTAAPDARFALANLSSIDSANVDLMELVRCQMIVIDKFISDIHRSGLDVGADMNEEVQLDAKGAVFYGLIDRIVRTKEVAGLRLYV